MTIADPATPPARRTTHRLPGPVTTSCRLPAAEVAVFCAVVPLLSLPVLLATMAATWALLVALVATAIVAWPVLARRTLVGDGWLADRRLWRYRVTAAEQLRAVQVVDDGRGGLLRLHPTVGRPHRLRCTDFHAAPARSALAAVVAAGPATLDRGAARMLSLPATASLVPDLSASAA